MEKIEYESVDTCPACSGNNYVYIRDMLNYTICEAETTCKQCGHKDYYAYGFYESGRKHLLTHSSDMIE